MSTVVQANIFHMLLLFLWCQSYQEGDICGVLLNIVNFNTDTGMKDSNLLHGCKKK
jgi:hypothetical protein